MVGSRVDLVHVEFAPTDRGIAMAELTLFIPRDALCHVQPDCQLWLSRAGNRAVILPQPGRRGCFRLSPRELIHVDRQLTSNRADGIARAEAWITRRVVTVAAGQRHFQ